MSTVGTREVERLHQMKYNLIDAFLFPQRLLHSLFEIFVMSKNVRRNVVGRSVALFSVHRRIQTLGERSVASAIELENEIHRNVPYRICD